MSPLYAVVAFVVAQRLAELAYAVGNTRRLRARGAFEVGAEHYPWLVTLHAAWLAALVLTVAPDTPLNLPILAVFGALQLVRAWVIATLGGRWTTRVIVLPGVPLVKSGPYRYLRHPNYAVVCAEFAVLPLMFGAGEVAVLFSALNLALLRHRVRAEEAALGLAPR